MQKTIGTTNVHSLFCSNQKILDVGFGGSGIMVQDFWLCLCWSQSIGAIFQMTRFLWLYVSLFWDSFKNQIPARRRTSSLIWTYQLSHGLPGLAWIQKVAKSILQLTICRQIVQNFLKKLRFLSKSCRSDFQISSSKCQNVSCFWSGESLFLADA